MLHKSVLLNESIELLNIKEDGKYVDCTLVTMSNIPLLPCVTCSMLPCVTKNMHFLRMFLANKSSG